MQRWKKVGATMSQAGWDQRAMDPCLFVLRHASGQLAGVACWHVDDMIVIGDESFRSLEAWDSAKRQQPFRKWAENGGKLCGTLLEKDAASGTIHLSQKEYAESLKPFAEPLQD